MKIVGSISNEEEKEELAYIAKIVMVGQKIRELSQEARKNEKK